MVIKISKKVFTTNLSDECLDMLKTKVYMSKKFRYYNEIIECLIENFLDRIDEHGNIIPEVNNKNSTTDEDGLHSEHLELFSQFKK